MVWDAGAVPVVVLNKADLCADPDGACESVRARLPLVDVSTVSALEDAGLERARAVPSSRADGGVARFVRRREVDAGQSSPRRRACCASARSATTDGKGRHTTTARQLVELPGGALLIDTPGMRELQPWGDESAVAAAFDDIDDAGRGVPVRRLRARWRTGVRCSGGRRSRPAGRRSAGELSPARPRGGVRSAETRQGRRRGTEAAVEADAPGARRRCTAIAIADNIPACECWSAVGLCASLWSANGWSAGPLSPRPAPQRFSRAPRDDEGPDRHRGASRLGAARRRSLLRARDRRATSTTTASSASSRGSGRSSGSTAIRPSATRWRTRTIPDDPRDAVERARHGGVRVRRAERADDAGLHRAEGPVRSAGRAGVRAVRPRRRRHGRRGRAEQRVRRERLAAASAPASSSRSSTAATRISTASFRGSIDFFMRW